MDEIVTTIDPAELRRLCEREIEAARRVKAPHDPEDARRLAREFTVAHTDRMRATHPVRLRNMLDALADQREQDAARIEELERALRDLPCYVALGRAFRPDGGDRCGECRACLAAALAQPRVDGPTETEVSDGNG